MECKGVDVRLWSVRVGGGEAVECKGGGVRL